MDDDRKSEFEPCRVAPPRYRAGPLSASRASRRFGKPAGESSDRFASALSRLSAEDEEPVLPEDQGPIVFKDGVFQIDVERAGAPAKIDPALKGLIDSILG